MLDFKLLTSLAKDADSTNKLIKRKKSKNKKSVLISLYNSQDHVTTFMLLINKNNLLVQNKKINNLDLYKCIGNKY